MRKIVPFFAAVLALFVLAPAANAAIPQVFTQTSNPVNCAVQPSGATAGQRWCGATGTPRIPSWDGTPIDTTVTFPPAPGDGPDGNFPLVGLYHGWGGSKSASSSAGVQRWVTQGYAVLSITDRGWGASCYSPRPQPACLAGYIHLMHNAYEVRDAQYLMGQLADDGVIDPQRIGATGGSYGGGLSAQLAALKNRTALPDGTLIPWVSPNNGIPMQIAAAAPEYPWTDLARAIVPNGSTLDYVADAPYKGPMGDHRFGVSKQNWQGSLYLAGQLLGYYSPTSGTNCEGGVCPDPKANLTGWNNLVNTGGPYDFNPAYEDMGNELTQNHSAYYIDDSVAPAPMLLSSGWNDDLFPVDESVSYYNKVRTDHPNTPIQMFHLDFGHSPRASSSASDVNQLTAAEDAWFAYYVKGVGSEPANSDGGVKAITSKCPTSGSGTLLSAPNWASLAPGEIRLEDATAKTITAPGTAPANAFTSGSVCTTQSGNTNASAATYTTDPAPAGGYTVAGSTTVSSTMTVNGTNDAVRVRLYDRDPVANTEVLIGRQAYRPLGVGEGPTEQLFQLHPQAWKVAAGHQLRLELLAQDSTYLRNNPAGAPQQNIQVSDLEMRVPVNEEPGSLGGLVHTPKPRILPEGYRLSYDEEAAPDVSNDAPGGVVETVSPDGIDDVTISAEDADGVGSDMTAEADGLPAGASLEFVGDSGDTDVPGTATWKVTADSITAVPGTYTVTVTVKDDYGKPGTTQFDIEVDKTPQTIDFDPIDDHLLGDADFDPGATASSGLSVNYLASGACTIDGGLVHITGLGSCEVTAKQGGNAYFKPASDVSHSFMTRRATSIDFAVKPAKIKKGKKLRLRAVITSPGLKKARDGQVTFKIDGDAVGGGDVNKNGRIVLEIPGSETTDLSVGTHTAKAKYSDANDVFASGAETKEFKVCPVKGAC